MSDQTGVDYLLVGDQMLWFGTRLPNSLLNPNQIRAYDEFGIDGHDAFIPFDTTGTIVHFDSRVPSAWEKTHLPIVFWRVTHGIQQASYQIKGEGVESRTNCER